MSPFEFAQSRFSELGLAIGGFHVQESDRTPGDAKTILLAIGALPEMWSVFRRSRESKDGDASPLDRWSARVLRSVASEMDAETAFPFDGPPYWPFLDWSRKAEPLWPSPIGLHIHSTYGMWFSCRGAIVSAKHLDLPARDGRGRPCDHCPRQPCRSACPVDAFSEGRYDVERCARHVASPAGIECRRHGCLVRRSCPVGTEFAQESARAAFHMDAFGASVCAKMPGFEAGATFPAKVHGAEFSRPGRE